METRRPEIASDRGLERVCRKIVIPRGQARYEQLVQMCLILRRRSRRLLEVDEAFLFLDVVGDQDCK